MIFITGGRSQGKRAYAERTIGPAAECIYDYQDRVRALMAEGIDPEAFTAQFLDAHPDVVIVMDEVGSGIVPIEAEERAWREACGRCGCLIAARADAVVRLVCGIPVVIKGKDPAGSRTAE